VRILGSDKTEKIRIEVQADRSVAVNVHKIRKNGQVADTPYYSRIFRPGETKELFIYSLDRPDVVSMTGNIKPGMTIYFMDPENEDSVDIRLAKKAKRKVHLFRGEKYEYDTAWHKKYKIYFIPVFTPSSYHAFDADPLDIFPRTGIKVSAGVTYTAQPWRKKQYQHIHSLNASYGFLRRSFNVGYTGRFGSLVGKWDLMVKGRLDAPAVENYFGTGNNTEIKNTTRNHYRTFSQRVYAALGLERNIDKTHHAEISLIYQSVMYQQINRHFLEDFPYIDPSVFDRKQFAGAEASYIYDRSNGSLYPRRGFTFVVNGGMLKNMSDSGASFAKINSSFAFYIPLTKSFTWATRVGAATLVGEPEFYHLNRLGGNAEMRGYERERFYGKSIFYTNNEIRWLTDTRNFLFNGKAGLVGFFDIGRVWMPGEISNRWHAGYGPGLVIIPYNKITLTAMYGLSKDGDNLFFRAQMFF
jgi:hypothetical protein